MFNGMKWYKRTALIYAVGTWTLLGSCVYYSFYKGDARGITIKEENKDKEDTTLHVQQFKSSHMSTKITYKENFVPYSTRLLELFRPKAEDSADAIGSENDEK